MKKPLSTNKKKDNIAPYIDELMVKLYDFIEEHEGKGEAMEKLVILFLDSQEASHIIGKNTKLSAQMKIAVLNGFLREIASAKDFSAEVDKHTDVLEDLFFQYSKRQDAKFDDLFTLYFDENNLSEYKRKIILGHFHEKMRALTRKNSVIFITLAVIFLTFTAFGVYTIPNYMRESGILAADISVFWIICLRILLTVVFLWLSFKLIGIILRLFMEKYTKTSKLKTRNS